MCQLSAVIFGKGWVYRKDGVRSHSNLLPLAQAEHPGDECFNAEMDFVKCEWGMANGDCVRIPAWAEPMLAEFAFEQWGIKNGRGDAEKLMNFVMHAGPPEADKSCSLLLAPIWAKTEAKLPAIWAKCKAELAAIGAKAEAELAAIGAKYEAERAAIWCGYFAPSDNRIEAWRD